MAHQVFILQPQMSLELCFWTLMFCNGLLAFAVTLGCLGGTITKRQVVMIFLMLVTLAVLG